MVWNFFEFKISKDFMLIPKCTKPSCLHYLTTGFLINLRGGGGGGEKIRNEAL